MDLGPCPQLKLSYFMILQRRNSFITESDGVAFVGRGRTGLSQGNSWERQLRRGLIPRGHTWRTLGIPHCSSNYNFPSSNPTEQHQNALTVNRVSKWPSPRPGVRTSQGLSIGNKVDIASTSAQPGRAVDTGNMMNLKCPKSTCCKMPSAIQESLRQPEGAATWWVLSECIKLVV